MNWIVAMPIVAVLLFAARAAAADPPSLDDPSPHLQAGGTAAADRQQVDATLDGTNAESLLSQDADPDARAQSLKYAVELALGGDGRAAFALGALFRSGEDHPAHATAKDLDSARHWFTKCLDARACPPMVLASLAELELEAGNVKAATQWAQAWAVVDQQLRSAEEDDSRPDDGGQAYAAFLLKRCMERIDRGVRDARAKQWFQELRTSRGAQLTRLLDMATGVGHGNGIANAELAEALLVRERKNVTTVRYVGEPMMALYLLRVPAVGGRAASVTLIEGLPRTRKLQDFKGIVSRFEFKPHPQGADAGNRFATVPISYADARYQLTTGNK